MRFAIDWVDLIVGENGLVEAKEAMMVVRCSSVLEVPGVWTYSKVMQGRDTLCRV